MRRTQHHDADRISNVPAASAVAGACSLTAISAWAIDRVGASLGGIEFTLLAGAAAASAAVALAGAIVTRRRLREAASELAQRDTRIEALSDRVWEAEEAEERSRAFLDLQGDLIVRRDRDGRVSYANQPFRSLLGERPGTPLARLRAPDVIEQGPVSSLPDGTRVHDQCLATAVGPRWIAWRDVTVRIGATTETQSVGRDVTERVVTERALAEARDQADAANRAKSRFLATVSHEIRTPLNGILGMTDLLLDTTLSPEQVAYARAVQVSGRSLLSLIEDILDFAKIEAGRIELTTAPFDLEGMVEEVVELLAPHAHEKRIDISSFVDGTLPRRLVGDAARLRQVLLNLAGNAVKFTEHGSVAIVVEPGESAGDVVITVEDSGIGIAPEAQSRIFDEFEQVDGSATRRHGGTGLGLAISHRIVGRMGGRLTVDSAPGRGSRFRIEVPLPAADREAADERASKPLAGTSVLMVAQDTRAVALVARRLDALGAETRVVAAEEAATALAEARWTTLVIDRTIGLAAIEAVARNPGAPTRRIALLRPGERGDLAALAAAGASDYLVKPVRAASLASRFGIIAAPHATEPRSSTSITATSVTSVSQPRPGLTVLVAEDNEINALLVRTLLTKLGHAPTVVSDGAAAVAAFAAAHAAGAPYDAVLMDLHMPVLDGLEAARRIRAHEAVQGMARTPMVALTADASPDEPHACRDAGLDSVLTKPLDGAKLAAAFADGPVRTTTAA